MRVLITGGAGYIGTETAKRLCSSDLISEIIIYDNLSRPNVNLFIGQEKLDERVRFVQADLLDTRTLKKHLKGVDVVIHLAAKVISPFSDMLSHAFEQVNHWGTAELVYAVEELKIPKLIHLSSATVYGSHEEPRKVGAPTAPKTFYGISKLRGEEHVQRLVNKGHQSCIIRCANVFGFSKSMRLDSVMNKMLFDAHFRNRIKIHGSGDQFRPFARIDTVANVLARMCLSPDYSGVYDLVEANYSINDIAKALKSIYPEMEMLFIDQNMNMRQLKVDTSNSIHHELSGPENQEELEQVLQRFAEHFTF